MMKRTEKSDDPADERSAADSLASEEAPVRRWLTRYFQRRVHNGADVDDLVQDVFTRIVTRQSTEPIEHLGGYIMKTAGSILADNARRRASRRLGSHVSFDPDHHGGEDLDPERVLTGKQDLHLATAALLSLTERTRTIFILRRLEGWRHADIAHHLGISVSAVEKHVQKAIRHVSAEMEKHNAS